MEVIDVKLNNRKTKKIGEKKDVREENLKVSSPVSEKISTTINKKSIDNTNIKQKNNTRFKMPDRRKGYIQKAQIGDHKFIFILENMMMVKLVKYLLIQIKKVS